MEKTLFRNLIQIIRQYWGRFLLGCFFLFLSNGLLILTPLVFRQAVMRVETEVWFSPLLWGVLLLALALLSGFFRYRMRVQFMDISRFAEETLRNKIFERMQAQSMAFFDCHPTGDLLSILTNDITAYQEVLGPGIMFPFYFFSISVPAFIALFFLSPPMAWLAATPLLILPLIMVFLRSYTYRISKALQESLSALSTQAHEIYSGIRLVKSYGIESHLERSFETNSRQFSRWSVLYYTFQGVLFPFMALITRFITVGLVFLAGLTLIKGWELLSAADYLSFMWIQSYLFIPILMLGWIIPIFERGRAAYDRLRSIYEEPIEVQGAAHSSLSIPKDADIRLTDLTFTYPQGEVPSLKNLSTTLPAKKFIGITGPVGAGKSTLFKLLTREYELPRGMLALGERDIHDYPLDAFSQTMVTVEQVPFLFSRTVGENVQFAHPDASGEDVVYVSKQVDLHETVMGFPQQYETLVGERGVTLSGGQKQRIAMARAFLLNRSILLLDDIFSSVDFETEKKIFSQMVANFRDRTVLMITQRATILEQLDWVLYFHDGSIVEEGTPNDLKKQKGRYAALIELYQRSE